LGRAAEQAGIAPTGLRASDALHARALCDLRGVPFSLAALQEPGSALPEGFAQRLELLLASALESVRPGAALAAAKRMGERLRAAALAR